MKRQKKDKYSRAFNRGLQAGTKGHSQDTCPYTTLAYREMWLGGWREGWDKYKNGLKMVS